MATSLVSNDNATMVGLLKEVYARSISQAWPEIAKLQERIKFDQASALGNKYNFPVDLVLEHGITAGAAGVTLRNGAYIPPSAGAMQNGQAQGFQFNGRASVNYAEVAASTTKGGREDQKKAFKSATSQVVKRLEGSLAKRLEIELLHGQQGIGVASANPANGASRDVVITAATFSPGIWAGEAGAVSGGIWRGATLEIWNAGLTAKISTGTSGNGDPISITAVDPVTRTVTISCLNATDQSLNLANANFFWESFSPDTEMAGLVKLGLVTNASQPVFGIDPAVYDLWQGNQYNVAGPIAFSKLMAASALIANYGAMGDSCAIVTPTQFEAINTDLAALRQFDVSYTKNKGEAGVKSITFYNQIGTLEVVPHLYQKPGYSNIFLTDSVKRVGSQDLEFVTGGPTGPQLLFNDANANAYEMRMFSEQVLVTDKMRNLCTLYGVTP